MRIYYISKRVIASHHLSCFQVDTNHLVLSFMVMNIQLSANGQKLLMWLVSSFSTSSIVGDQRRESSHLDIVYRLNTSPTSQMSWFSIAALHCDT